MQMRFRKMDSTHTCITLSLGLAAVIALLTPVSDVSAQAGDNSPGLSTGKAAPDLKLTDQHGKQPSLEELRSGGKSVAIVFHRSADW